jgi:peptidoglycan/LPS O-acetylase OafA/YrhL
MERNRRHDIDNLRIIAIALLLFYHVAIVFQPWGFLIGFITNPQPLTGLWPIMAMLNVWRIPLLFFITGLGVFFALQNRNWQQMLLERTRRIFVPLVFGGLAIVPLHVLILQAFFKQNLSYQPGFGHLWFLGNIFGYVLLLSPLFYVVQKQQHSPWVQTFARFLAMPWSLLLVVLAFQVEAKLLAPAIYEMYALTWHGFFLGLLGFFCGFCFGLAGPGFWAMLQRWRWLLLLLALGLYGHRLVQVQMKVPLFLLVLESNFWIFSLFAFAYKYLNVDYRLKNYLSKAAYPVYLLHMVWLYLFAYWIVPLDWNVWIKFFSVLLGTFAGSFLTYGLLVRRIGVLGYLFGVK